MGKPLSKKVVAAVLLRDGGFCVLRISPDCLGVALVADHRANRGAGGAKSLDGMSNLLASCSFCNGAKEDADGVLRDQLLALGVRVQSDSTHQKTALRALHTPVRYPDGRIFFLDDDGGRVELDATPY